MLLIFIFTEIESYLSRKPLHFNVVYNIPYRLTCASKGILHTNFNVVVQMPTSTNYYQG